MATIGHRIAGEVVTSPSTFPVENPATGEHLVDVAEANAEHVDRAVRAAREAFATWGRSPAATRAAAMRRLADVIDAHVDEIARLESRDTGLPIAQTLKATIPRAADNFRFFAEIATRTDGHT
jgi:5-carboxymethyl-2-hydroxymuconic-semialdehyde dehydrogenase